MHKALLKTSQCSPNVFFPFLNFFKVGGSDSWAPLWVQPELPSPRAAQITDGSRHSSRRSQQSPGAAFAELCCGGRRRGEAAQQSIAKERHCSHRAKVTAWSQFLSLPLIAEPQFQRVWKLNSANSISQAFGVFLVTWSLCFWNLIFHFQVWANTSAFYFVRWCLSRENSVRLEFQLVMASCAIISLWPGAP